MLQEIATDRFAILAMTRNIYVVIPRVRSTRGNLGDNPGDCHGR